MPKFMNIQYNQKLYKYNLSQGFQKGPSGTFEGQGRYSGIMSSKGATERPRGHNLKLRPNILE